MRRTWLPRIRIERARDGRAAPAPSEPAGKRFARHNLHGFPGLMAACLAVALPVLVTLAGPCAADEIASERTVPPGVVAVADGSTRDGPDCTCRYFGANYRLGETVCLRGPDGPRLARCSMALNNTTWQPLDRPCPTSARAPLMLAAAPLCLPGG